MSNAMNKNDQAKLITKSQLRDMLVAYFAKVDPHLLQSGIDINGIVEWSMYYGVTDTDARLKARYGIGLDFSLVQTASPMVSISSIPKDKSKIDVTKSNLELMEKLKVFYTKYDQSKLPKLQSFVDWINIHGIEKFNIKLLEKYGDDLTPPNPSKPVAANNNSATVSNTVAPVQASGTSATSDVQKQLQLHQQPTPKEDNKQSTINTKASAAVITQKLEKFYKKYEPGKLDHIKPIVDWAVLVGEEELSKKLFQIYGEHLNFSDDVSLSGTTIVSFSPGTEANYSVPAQETKKPNFMHDIKNAASQLKPTPSNNQQKEINPSLANKLHNFGAEAAAIAAAKGNFAFKEAEKAIDAQAALKDGVIAEYAKRAAKPAEVPGRKRSPSEGPCDNYKLDMRGTTFGVCECGFPRFAHVANQQKPTWMNVQRIISAAQQLENSNNESVDDDKDEFENSDSIPEFHSPLFDKDAPLPPIEETDDATAMSNALEVMSKEYLEGTGEHASISLQQEWVGELFHHSGRRAHLSELAKATARLSIDSRLKQKNLGL